MDDVNLNVLKNFGLSPKRIYKEKSYYICVCQVNSFKISTVFCSKEEVVYQHKIKECLFSQGFSTTDRFLCAETTGEPFYEFNNELYTVSDYFSSNDADFSNFNKFTHLLASVSKLHVMLEFSGLTEKKLSIADFETSKRQDLESYSKLKKLLSTKKRLSDFDVSLMRHLDFFHRKTEESYELLEKNNYCSLITESAEKGSICHFLLKEENIRFEAEDAFILNFSEARSAPQIIDLAHLIKRYFQFNLTKSVPVSKLINAYSKTKELSEIERNCLKAWLIYPDRVLKIIGEYINKKRNWVPGKYVSKFENILQSNNEYYEYIDEIIRR